MEWKKDTPVALKSKSKFGQGLTPIPPKLIKIQKFILRGTKG